MPATWYFILIIQALDLDFWETIFVVSIIIDDGVGEPLTKLTFLKFYQFLKHLKLPTKCVKSI